MELYKLTIITGWIVLIINMVLDYIINIDVRINLVIYLICIVLFLYGLIAEKKETCFVQKNGENK